MDLLPLTRLTVVGLLLFLPGAYFGIRFTSGFIRVLSRKFRRGKPYLRGSATDYFSYAVGSTVLALGGAYLCLASALQGGMQPFAEPREVGQVFIKPEKGSSALLTLLMEEDHPELQKVDFALSDPFWALEGEFLEWKVGAPWLGFRDGHRIEAVLRVRHPDQTGSSGTEARDPVSGTYPLWYLAHRQGGWLPMLKTSRRRTPWMPTTETRYRILIGPTGYVLIEEKTDVDFSDD